VQNHIWYQELDDGNFKKGMAAVATVMAGRLVIKPLEWDAVRQTRVAGRDVAAPCQAKMTAGGFAGRGG